MKNNKGFVVSAVLYPLLVLFLALIMGLLAMTDTRKRILDKMKLEISNSIFDEATCSCDTILNKLNYLIKNGVGGSGGGGSYTYNVLGLNVKGYETPNELPNVGNGIGDIAVITDIEVTNYYVSKSIPENPKEGTVWVVQDRNSEYYIESDYSKIGVSYVMQYTEDTWVLKKAYVYKDASWQLLYYVPVSNGEIDLTNSDINAQIEHTYSYTGEYQEFHTVFSGVYQIELWGAQGGSYGGTGGKGTYTSGEIYLEAGITLYIYVGGASTGGSGSTQKGGWNGGGNSGNVTDGGSGGGGGATDIRLMPGDSKTDWSNFDSLKSRIMVAAGGGGASYYSSTAINGGAGGGLSGYNGSSGGPGAAYYAAGGGTQVSGGSHAGRSFHNISGNFGKGSNADSYGGGGGGGYYGGGGGTSTSSRIYSGAGGSSYISGYDGCFSILESSLATNLLLSHDAYHYSGYYFSNTTMTPNSNTSNGKAVITLLSVNIVKEREKSFSTVRTFEHVESYHKVDIVKTGTYKIELWGAQGGSYGGTGGKGSYTKGEIYLNKGDVIYLYVGSAGAGGSAGFGRYGGWNGGGNAGESPDGGSGSGGGATDIRLDVGDGTYNDRISLKSRIMVAAGGGGASYYSSTAINGGAGGGLFGYSGSSGGPGAAYYAATGGSQTLGGSKAGGSLNNYTGIFGGGSNSDYYGGGGGSGWYGGGGGTSTSSRIYSGAGGSSYISGHAGCIAVNSDGNPKVETYATLNDSISYTGYKFTNTVMIDGNGYTWGTQKMTQTYMPTHDGTTTMTGNTGNGYAKITYLGQ